MSTEIYRNYIHSKADTFLLFLTYIINKDFLLNKGVVLQITLKC